jgi:HD-GYP domain-containing protein (c-di-GMP phosphodiesterase class II)
LDSRTARVQRRLVVRTGLAALLLSLAVGALSHQLGRADLEREILDEARLRGDLLRQGVERRLAEGEHSLAGALLAELATPAVTLPQAEAGRFVAVLLLDGAGNELLRQARPGAAAAPWEPLLANPAADRPSPTLGRLRAAGQERVAVAVPFAAAGGSSHSELRAWFELSDQAAAALFARARRSAVLAAAVVLLTALALYTIVRRLLERQARLSVDLLDANLETLAALGSAIAKRDADTDAHNFRVVVYSAHLAAALGQSEDFLRRLIKGAFVHDVGKIGIRDAVLLKPGRLDEEEFREMQRHVEHGLEIVGRSSWLADAAPVVGGHHEKFGGGGYPRGLAGEAIPLAARIFALADVFDAVTSDRPYHQPKSLEDALELLEAGRGTHFDPGLLDAFARIAPELHAVFANRSAEPRQEALALVARYFREDPEALLGGSP